MIAIMPGTSDMRTCEKKYFLDSFRLPFGVLEQGSSNISFEEYHAGLKFQRGKFTKADLSANLSIHV